MHTLASAGLQFEVQATFVRPDCGSQDCSFGVFIRATSDLSVRTEITFTALAATGPFNNTDMPGGDYRCGPGLLVTGWPACGGAVALTPRAGYCVVWCAL